MHTSHFTHPDEIRTRFAAALSAMYQREVPLYGDLIRIVAEVNRTTSATPAGADAGRLDTERHGAVRVGTAAELATLRRLFAVMGMVPVGYYDLSMAGVPVHATAFRPVDAESLQRNPFRVFTSLLRLELIADPTLRAQAAGILSQRDVFTPACRAYLDLAEGQGGLLPTEADHFIDEALETFRWHGEATVEWSTYRRLRELHPLIADVVCFRGPHINHLTPRVLDIDAAQAGMRRQGMRAKAEIEGPPRRHCPVLLRQTSFIALEEPVRFAGRKDAATHTARFGEIEQRGCALTRAGRARYDTLLAQALERVAQGVPREEAMEAAFAALPDRLDELFSQGLAFVRFLPDPAKLRAGIEPPTGLSVAQLVGDGWLKLEPMTYEDFLPVSAAGIFRSNLGERAPDEGASLDGGEAREAFECALGASPHCELSLYEKMQARSLGEALRQFALNSTASVRLPF